MIAPTPELAVVLAVVIPLVGALLIALADRSPNKRELATLLAAGLLFADVLYLLNTVLNGARPSVQFLEVMPSLRLVFEVEPLGMLFATVASGLWVLNSVYSIGYMRGTNEKNQTRFYICFAVAIASTMAIAFSGNMFTLFFFYEALTLSTYPLVIHKGTPEALAGGRTYLGILLATSIVLLLLGVVWTWVLAGTLDFEPGGILEGKVQASLIPVLLALYMFGIGKAALMPFHRWLPAAMVAPTPVSALLHAVAVVKAGVFCVLKVAVYIFGIDFLAVTGASVWLMWVAAASILISSIVALTKDNLKARLAYSTISQLSYVTLGAALATSAGIVGGGLQIVMHAFGKITLFMCAGAIYVATQKTEISDMEGLGRIMPFTFGAFLVGALSIIGLPPLGGAWSKLALMAAAADTGQIIMIGVLMLSSVLNVAYLLPLVVRGFFAPQPARAPGSGATYDGLSGIREAPAFCVVPPCLTAFGCILLFFFAEPLRRFLEQIF